ncbi:MAG: fumarate hydratase [Clostridiales bacterium]|nr:fumarate hydratase [Clostridiales bacterium]
MREISAQQITMEVKKLLMQANYVLPADAEALIGKAQQNETNGLAKEVLAALEQNLCAAKEMELPICQDTGMAVLFVELGREVCIVGGEYEEAIHEGVRQAYTQGFLRKSVVRDPLFDRVNTNDNTPAIIHTRIVPGDKVKITVAPKGFGSENMSAIKMFTPSAKREDIIQFVLDTVRNAGGNPCPPLLVGVGIGGTFEYCALLAKKALTRPVSQHNASPEYQALEEDLLTQINQLGIGPQGFGGDTTALAVNVEWYPTHIAGLPVAVNINCHVMRHAETIL